MPTHCTVHIFTHVFVISSILLNLLLLITFLLLLNTFVPTQCLVVTTLAKEEKKILVWGVNFPVAFGHVLVLGIGNCLADPQMV